MAGRACRASGMQSRCRDGTREGHPTRPWGDNKGTRGMSGRETRLPPTRSFVTPYCRCCRCCCCGRLLGVAGDCTMRASRDRQYVRFVRVDILRPSQWRTPPEWSTCVCTARVSRGTVRHAASFPPPCGLSACAYPWPEYSTVVSTRDT